MKRFRSWWRRHFNPEPPARLDGLAARVYRTLYGLTWEQAWQRRIEENKRRRQAWLEGVKF